MVARIHLIKFKVVIKSKKGTHLSAFSYGQSNQTCHGTIYTVIPSISCQSDTYERVDCWQNCKSISIIFHVLCIYICYRVKQVP